MCEGVGRGALTAKKNNFFSWYSRGYVLLRGKKRKVKRCLSVVFFLPQGDAMPFIKTPDRGCSENHGERNEDNEGEERC